MINLFDARHEEETISNVRELPRRPQDTGSSFVVTTDVRSYFVRVSVNRPWMIVEEKTMHGETL